MKFKTLRTLSCCLSGTLFAPGLFAQDTQTDEGMVYELSPFTVEVGTDVGYMATTTLAGSRLNTPLRDVASAVSVLTAEVFEDTGATDAGTILSYALNAETGGLQGNFAGSGFDGGNNRTDNDESRINPQGNQRIRGLGSATLTRNFFLTDFPFDSYNSSRATINRGPNSILFGLGTPGGIINNTLNMAEIGQDFGDIGIRFGANGSHRQTIDYNKSLIEDRLAVRLAVLNDNTKYEQEPAYRDDTRWYGAIRAVLFDNDNVSWLGQTVLRGNYESGEIESNPPSALPPNNIYHAWWDGLKVDYEKYTGVAPFDRLLPPSFESKFTANTLVDTSVPDMLTVADIPNFIQVALVYEDPGEGPSSGFSTQFPDAQGFQGRVRLQPSNEIFDMFFTRSPELEIYASGFITPSIQDRNVFDYRKHLFSGNMDRMSQNFDAYNLTLEQTFFKDKRAGIEVAFDKQDWSRYSRLIVNSEVAAVFGNKDVAIDISQFYGNGDANPNVGRAVVRLDKFGDYRTRDIEREAMQATAYYELDFDNYGDTLGKWLGRHTFTGFFSSQEFTQEDRLMSNTWIGPAIDSRDALGGRQGGWGRRVQGYVYVSDDLRGTSGPGDVRLQQMNIPVPEDGDQYTVWYQDNQDRGFYSTVMEVESMLDGGDIGRREIDSEAFIVQSSFLQDHLVTMFGWRTDEATNFENLTVAQVEQLSGTSGNRLPAGPLKEENFILQGEPSSVAKGNTFTQSVVAHVPEQWTSFVPGNTRFSLHWGESENFNPAGLRRSVWGDVLSPPTGTTEEYGFSVDINKKFIARFNWFETSLNDANAGIDAAAASNRVAFYLNRAVVQPQNEGWEFADAKAWMIQDVGTDLIPNINSYDDMEAAIRGLMPAEIASQYNIQIVDTGDGTLEVQSEAIPSQIATADQVAEGFELDLVGQITPNWRVMLNVAKQETTQSNSAVEYKRLVDYMTSQFEDTGLLTLRDSPTVGEITTFTQRWSNLVLAPLNAVLARDGTVSLEQRKWRVNLITNYNFSRDSNLKGFSVGGAVRWQDKAGVGYNQLVEDGVTIPDLSKPYFAPSTWNGDIWLSYRYKLTDKIDWKIQLNVRNAIGDDDDIPFKINPDGQVAVIRVPNERVWFITNTFSF